MVGLHYHKWFIEDVWGGTPILGAATDFNSSVPQMFSKLHRDTASPLPDA